MYVYCVYPVMLVTPKATAKLSKRSRNKPRSNCFFMVTSMKSAFILLPCFTIAQHESGTRKAMYW